MDYILGCNYWASHAGAYMWRKWDRAVVETDMQRLSECGIHVLRAFPLWSDFQPLTFCDRNGKHELRHGDKPLNRLTPEGLAGVDMTMIHHFEEFVELAKQYNMQLIIPLITGWMSGRMFFPPAFEQRNPISDYETIKWEVRFVKYFVEHFKHYDNIIAWEPGNETNVMSFADDGWKQGNYWVWLSTIIGTIRSADNTRPVISGIHGLKLRGEGSAISEVGELCDILTVHPYPAFMPHCYVDGYNTMKSMLHGTTESIYYAQISGKPCLCEEIGHLSNSIGCEEVVADYMRANLFALWAHGFPGLLWWCACDQDKLDFPPYDWCACERELGLLRSDGSKKPIAEEMAAFRTFLAEQTPLPAYQTDAVCILSADQDNWAVVYSVNLLCKQAGLDVQFVDGEDILPSANVYLLPSLKGDAIPRRTWVALMEQVQKGATLYVSWDDAILSGFEAMTGTKVRSNSIRKNAQVSVSFSAPDVQLDFVNERKLTLVPFQNVEILGSEPDGNPAFIRHTYGNGEVYFLAFPMEAVLADQPQAFENTQFYRIYQQMFADRIDRKIVSKSSPKLAITEHPVNDKLCTIVAMNYADEEAFTLSIKSGWTLSSVEYGQVSLTDCGCLNIAPAPKSVCRFTLKRILHTETERILQI